MSSKEKTIQWKMFKVLIGDAMELPFEDNSFDYVTIGLE